MTTHIYFMPIIRHTLPDGTDNRGPKYYRWRAEGGWFNEGPDVVDVRWGMMDYGDDDLCISIADTDLLQHQSLRSHSDVLSIDPQDGSERDLNLNVTAGELTALSNYFDQYPFTVPVDWTNPSMTRRTVLRIICGMFLLVQMLVVPLGRFSDLGITLSTKWADLTPKVQQWLLVAGDKLNYQGPPPTDTTTVRQIFHSLGEAASHMTFWMAGFPI